VPSFPLDSVQRLTSSKDGRFHLLGHWLGVGATYWDSLTGREESFGFWPSLSPDGSFVACHADDGSITLLDMVGEVARNEIDGFE